MRLRSFVILVLAGCGAASPEPPKGGNDALSAPAIAPLPKAETQASAPPRSLVPRWELHPPGGAHARARLPLEEGTSIYVTDGGARWLVRGEQATSAPTLLPDALATVMRTSPDPSGLWFVGVSGNVYPARDPLGETGEPRRPLFRCTR